MSGEKNLKVRKKSQKISIERVLKLMILIKNENVSKTALMSFRDDLKIANPKIKKNAIFEVFQRQFGILERKRKAMPQVQATAQEDTIKPEELKAIQENVKILNPPPLPSVNDVGMTIDDYKILLER